MLPLRSRCAGPDAMAANQVDAGAGAIALRILEIGSGELAGRAAAKDTREQKRRGALDHGERSALQEIGKPDVNGIFAAADGEHETGVRIILHAKTRRAAVTVQAREHALEHGGAAGNDRASPGHILVLV